MVINGVEFDIDFTDADTLERIDTKKKEIDKEVEELEKIKQTLSPAEGIRQECKIIKEFLDYVLGDGASEKIFGQKNSLNLCLKAFEDIITYGENQYSDMQERMNKYSPDRFKR